MADREDDGRIEITTLASAVIANQQGIDALEEAMELVDELKESFPWDSNVSGLANCLETVVASIGYLHHFEGIDGDDDVGVIEGPQF